MTGPADRYEFERLRRLVRRGYVGRVALFMMYSRVRFLGVLVPPLALGLKLTRAITSRKVRYDLKRWTNEAAALHARFDALARECRSLSQESVANQHAALLAEQSRLLTAAEALKAPHSNLGIATFHYLLHEIEAGVFRISRKQEALLRILSQRDESPTFYYDLLLWLVVPGSHSEDLAGDLMEECQLRIDTDGEGRARSWYHEQVVSTIMDHVPFKRIVAILAAIWTLLQWTYRFFTK